LKRPENALLGIMSVDWHVVDFPWVVKNAGHWVYRGMGVSDGDLFPGVVGIESDGVVQNGAAPSGITLVADSPDIGGEALGLDRQQASVYETAAGGFVFAAGSIRFPATLSGGRAQLGPQRLVRNLFERAGAAPVGPEQTLGAADGFAGADFSRAASAVRTLAGGTPGYADGVGAAARFASPMGLALAPDGSVIVADAQNRRIRRVQPDGTVTTVAGSGAEGDDDGPGGAASFHGPWAVAVAPDGTIYVTDPRGHRVRQIDAAGNVTTMVKDMGAPAGVTRRSDGALLVSDLYDGAVRSVDNGGSGAVRMVFAGGQLDYPTGLSTYGDQLWIIDSGNRVVRRLLPDGTLGDVAGNQEGGFADGGGDHARIAPLIGMARLGDAMLVADAGNYRVRRIEPGSDAASTVVRTVAGAPHLGSADGRGDQAGLIAPTGIAVDPARNLVYVSDTGNSSIRVITP
jgi:DNA-binding beta-propeller fold protein YncE